MTRLTSQVCVGDTVSAQEVETIHGEKIAIPDPMRLVHLQLRRFAGCPVCHLHLQSVVARHQEITAATITEVVVFHSTTDELRQHASHLPFAVVADPDKRLYRQFGVETSRHAILRPRAWRPILEGLIRRLSMVARRREHLVFRPRNGVLGLPADILIAPTGTVIAHKYGEHAYDQWTVDELLAHARPRTLQNLPRIPNIIGP